MLLNISKERQVELHILDLTANILYFTEVYKISQMFLSYGVTAENADTGECCWGLIVLAFVLACVLVLALALGHNFFTFCLVCGAAPFSDGGRGLLLFPNPVGSGRL